MQSRVGELMGEKVEEDNVVPIAQGAVLLGVSAQAGLETSVAGYLASFEEVLTTIVHAAEALADDGLTLEDFVVLLKGGDIA